MPRKGVIDSLSSGKNTKIDFPSSEKKGFTLILAVFITGCGRENHQHEQTLQASSPTLPKAYWKYVPRCMVESTLLRINYLGLSMAFDLLHVG